MRLTAPWVLGLLSLGCRTPAAVSPAPAPSPIEAAPPNLRAPCDMPGNPAAPTFASLDSVLSPAAKELSSRVGSPEPPCRFQRDEHEGSRSISAAKAFCREQASRDPEAVRAACRELCIAEIDFGGSFELFTAMVRTLERLAGHGDALPRGCLDGPPQQQWVCAKGPTLPASFTVGSSKAGLARVEGRFVEHGATWVLEVVETGACGRAFREVRQLSPPISCRQANVEQCSAERL